MTLYIPKLLMMTFMATFATHIFGIEFFFTVKSFLYMQANIYYIYSILLVLKILHFLFVRKRGQGGGLVEKNIYIFLSVIY